MNPRNDVATDAVLIGYLLQRQCSSHRLDFVIFFRRELPSVSSPLAPINALLDLADIRLGRVKPRGYCGNRLALICPDLGYLFLGESISISALWARCPM